MDEFFLLQKEKNSLEKNIKLINSIYYLGYPEKSKQKLYILLDKYNKEEFNKNINKIFTLLDKNNFDSSVVNSLNFIINKVKKEPLDREITDIYLRKNLPGKPSVSENNKKTEIKKTENSTSQNNKDKEISTKSRNINDKDKNIEIAIVLSEWLDDLDMDNAMKYALMLSNDKYFGIISRYLSYMKNKDIKQLEKINKKSPLYYHIMISEYKKNNNKQKALQYLEKLKKEYPKYLNYNRIDL